MPFVNMAAKRRRRSGGVNYGALVAAFLAGEDGFARDPADNTTVFSDTAGTAFQTPGSSAVRWNTFWGKTPYNWQGVSSCVYDTNEIDYSAGHYTTFSAANFTNGISSFFSCERVALNNLAANHSLYAFSTNTAGSTRLNVRALSDGSVNAGCRRLDGESAASITSATGLVSAGVFFVISAEFNYTAGTMRVWLNGALVASGAMTSSGTVSATNSARARDGADLTASPTQILNGSKRRGVFSKNKIPTDAERAAIEAWVGGAGSNAIDANTFVTPSIGSTVSMVATRHDILEAGTTQSLGSQAYGHAGFYDSGRDVSVFTWLRDIGATTARVAELDHATGAISAPVTIATMAQDNDNHLQVTAIEISDGRYVAMYGSHNTAQEWAVSNSAGSIAAWTVQTALPSGTYPKMVDFPSGGGAGTLHYFYRETGTRYLSHTPITYTSLGALVVGTKVDMITSGGRVYAAANFEKNGSDIEFCWTFADGGDTYRRGVYFGRYDPVAGTLENFDGSYSQAIPVTKEQADNNFRLVHVGMDQNTIPQFCRDSGGDAHITYARGNGVGDWDIVHMVHDGVSWSSKSKVGTSHEYDAGSGFCDGPSIAPITNGIAILAPTGTVGGGFTSGGTHLRIVERVSGVWNATQVAASVGAISDAVPIRGDNDELRFLSTETNNGTPFTKTPIYTIGTQATTWAAHT